MCAGMKGRQGTNLASDGDRPGVDQATGSSQPGAAVFLGFEPSVSQVALLPHTPVRSYVPFSPSARSADTDDARKLE